MADAAKIWLPAAAKAVVLVCCLMLLDWLLADQNTLNGYLIQHIVGGGYGLAVSLGYSATYCGSMVALTWALLLFLAGSHRSGTNPPRASARSPQAA